MRVTITHRCGHVVRHTAYSNSTASLTKALCPACIKKAIPKPRPVNDAFRQPLGGSNRHSDR